MKQRGRRKESVWVYGGDDGETREVRREGTGEISELVVVVVVTAASLSFQLTES